MRGLAPETDSYNIFAPGACSLISNQFHTREQNSGAKVLLRNIFFRKKSLVQTSFARGACCRSVLQKQAPSCVPAVRNSEFELVRLLRSEKELFFPYACNEKSLSKYPDNWHKILMQIFPFYCCSSLKCWMFVAFLFYFDGTRLYKLKALACSRV